MAKKKRKESAGAPEWMVTYGDMMTLLLCFFVMIVAMSEIREDDERYQDVVESMRKTFGYKGGIGSFPTRIPPDVSQLKRKQATAGENIKLHAGESAQRIMRGRTFETKTVREGRRFVVGGITAFEPGGARLLPAGREQLALIAEKIRGLRHVIDVRGHTSKSPLADDSPYADHLDLSWARARAVRDWLAGTAADQGRIDSCRLMVSGCGANQPVAAPAYSADDQVRNDRVEIVVTEAVVREYVGSPGEAAAMDPGAEYTPGRATNPPKRAIARSR